MRGREGMGSLTIVFSLTVIFLMAWMSCILVGVAWRSSAFTSRWRWVQLMGILTVVQWLVGYLVDAPFTPTLASIACYLSTFIVAAPDDTILKKKRSAAAGWYLKGLASATIGFTVGAGLWVLLYSLAIPQLLRVI